MLRGGIGGRRRLGRGIGGVVLRPSAAPAPSGPVILNGDFTDTSHWTIASGGGAASMSIAPGSPGTLNSVSGSGNTASITTQTLSGVVSGQSYTISGTCTARVNGGITAALGGGAGVALFIGVGPFTATIVAGSSNQDLAMWPSSGIGGRSSSITGLSIA